MILLHRHREAGARIGADSPGVVAEGPPDGSGGKRKGSHNVITRQDVTQPTHILRLRYLA